MKKLVTLIMFFLGIMRLDAYTAQIVNDSDYKVLATVTVNEDGKEVSYNRVLPSKAYKNGALTIFDESNAKQVALKPVDQWELVATPAEKIDLSSNIIKSLDDDYTIKIKIEPVGGFSIASMTTDLKLQTDKGFVPLELPSFKGGWLKNVRQQDVDPRDYLGDMNEIGYFGTTSADKLTKEVALRILGLPENYNEVDLNMAYNELMRRWDFSKLSGDQNKDLNEETFIFMRRVQHVIQLAYELLAQELGVGQLNYPVVNPEGYSQLEFEKLPEYKNFKLDGSSTVEDEQTKQEKEAEKLIEEIEKSQLKNMLWETDVEFLQGLGVNTEQHWAQFEESFKITPENLAAITDYLNKSRALTAPEISKNSLEFFNLPDDYSADDLNNAYDGSAEKFELSFRPFETKEMKKTRERLPQLLWDKLSLYHFQNLANK